MKNVNVDIKFSHIGIEKFTIDIECLYAGGFIRVARSGQSGSAKAASVEAPGASAFLGARKGGQSSPRMTRPGGLLADN